MRARYYRKAQIERMTIYAHGHATILGAAVVGHVEFGEHFETSDESVRHAGLYAAPIEKLAINPEPKRRAIRGSFEVDVGRRRPVCFANQIFDAFDGGRVQLEILQGIDLIPPLICALRGGFRWCVEPLEGFLPEVIADDA